ncbi:MAG: sigma-70 family RNA polymerase sigma factor [Kiritimatiellae bacterium]|nr:sigma-70 family RNA polymerase sigma factor [Kiritimatiellia bacterium]
MVSIVEEIRNNPEKGAKLLESEYKAGLMSLARRFCTDESDAEALVNRTFAIVVEKIDSYLEQSAFFGWMSRILVNCHSKDVRRKSNEMELCNADIPEDAPDDDASARIFREVDASILRDAIEQLPSDMKRTILLHYFMDMPVREVAKVLSVPSGTVMWRLHYARQILAAKLGANLKKPLVLLVMAGLLLAASVAAVVVGHAGDGSGTNEASTTCAATAATGTLPEPPSTTSVPDDPDVPEFPPSSSTPQGETTMSKTKATATALTAVLAAAPLAAESAGDYQFIISGDPVAAATEGSFSASSDACALAGGPLADGTVFAPELEGRYRTTGESPARRLRSDELRSFIITLR